ncbi:hypothetical protein D3C81_1649950 [compost metagenome]
MEVDHALHVVAALVQGAVDREAGGVDLEAVIADRPAFGIDLHEARSRDLVEKPAVRIDQELVLRAWHAHGNMGVDQVGELELCRQAVGGGQLHAHRPFFLADIARLAVAVRVRGGNHGGVLWGNRRKSAEVGGNQASKAVMTISTR